MGSGPAWSGGSLHGLWTGVEDLWTGPLWVQPRSRSGKCTMDEWNFHDSLEDSHLANNGAKMLWTHVNIAETDLQTDRQTYVYVCIHTYIVPTAMYACTQLLGT